MVSGGRDQTTRLWDVETQKQLTFRKIDRNVVTYLEWLPNSQDRFIELSEDLTLRLWDIKIKPFKPTIEVKIGTNFATTCDISTSENRALNIVTGHRGFNNEGAEIKLWDLRALNNDSVPLFTYK